MNASDLIVLDWLDELSWQEGCVTPTQEEIEAAADISSVTVQRVLERLTGAGQLTIEERAGHIRYSSATRDFVLGWRLKASGATRRRKPALTAKPRSCMTCGGTFRSDHKGHRICDRCKASPAFQSAKGNPLHP